MNEKNLAAFGIYSAYEGLESAVDSLEDAGFRKTDLSILFQENEGSKDLAFVKVTKFPEGTVIGAAFGAVIGGALGWLVGVMGALTIPGVGSFIAASPIVAALSGFGAGISVGGIVGGLIGLRIPEYEAKRHEGRVRDGGFLLSVHCDDSVWAKRAEEILERTGAENIATTREASADYAEADRPLARRKAA